MIIVGSQSILGSFEESELPDVATLSREIDVLPDSEDPAEAERLRPTIDVLMIGT